MSERPQSAATWFEIPTLSIERAQAFYEQVLEMNMQSFPDENPMVVFPKDPAGTGGALVQREFQKPCDSGTVVYLSCKGDLAPVRGRQLAVDTGHEHVGLNPQAEQFLDGVLGGLGLQFAGG